MAINKRKILQAAQKNLQKGAFDKALKDYKTLLEADPKDVNLRLKVGDVYLKQGKSDEAVAAYIKVAERFMKDGFDAKAVALYKQITKIDSKRVDVYVPLAELYQRLGLISDAMGSLQTAADAHYREGDKPAALELLRKMATLDPANTTSRLKVAELLRQEGMTPEALSEFEAVAEELERQDEVEGRVSVLLKILELEPEQGKALEGLGRSYIAQRKWSQGEEIGRRLVSAVGEFAVEGYEILVEAAEGLGRGEELPELYQSMAQALRERGDDARARELVQRYCGGGALSADGADLPQIESVEDAAAFDAAVGGQGAFGDDELDDPGFVTDAGVRLGSPTVERDAIDGRRRSSASTEASNRDMPLPPIDRENEAPEGDESDATDTPAPEGDPEQLVAEASVYLRYGKSERAVESLRAALAQQPTHLVALEKLGEALHASGDSENAVRTWLRGAEVAAAEGDSTAVSGFHARVGELDPGAVPSDEPEPVLAAAGGLAREESGETLSDEDDIEIEIDEAEFEIAAAASSPAETRVVAPDAAAALDDDDATEVGLDDELELDEEMLADDDTLQVAPDAAEGAAAGVEVEVALSDAELPVPAGSQTPGFHAADGALAPADDEFLTDEPVSDAPASEEPVFDEALSEALVFDTPSAEAGATEEPVLDGSFSDELVTDEPLGAASATEEPVLDEAFSDELVTDEPVSDGAEPTFDDSASDEFVTDEPAGELAAAAGDLDSTRGPVALDAPGLDADVPELGGAADDLDAELGGGAGFDLDEDALRAELEAGGAAAPNRADLEASGAAAPNRAVSASGASSSTTPQQIVDELEEGEFYLEQGMLEEAAEVYQRILAVAPSHPQAMVRLGEIEVRRGEEPAAAVPKEDVAEPAADDDEITGELHSASDPQDAATTELESESEPVSAAEEDGDFDLAAELSDVFEEDASAHRARSSAGTEEEGFEQVFAAFKAGVDRELGAGDHEARYDLGIAYKEMGLLDDAIGEFRVAMQDADRRLQSLHMMGVCALDLGRAEDAVAHFEQALAVQDVPEDQQMALRFDLGRAEEARGDRERARAAWEAVVAFDPDFQDVGTRLEALDREPPPEPVSDDSEEAFESFDDLIDESVADEPAAEPEAAEEYESFDDLMSDDDDDEDESTEAAAAAAELSGPESAAVASAPEDDPAGADVTQVAEVTAEETEEPVLDMAPAEAFDAVPEPDPDPESPAPKKRRRKRISFM